MKLLYATLRVVAASIVSSLATGITLAVAGAWFLDRYATEAQLLHMLVTAVAVGAIFSIGAALLDMLGVKTLIASFVIGAMATFAIFGAGGGYDQMIQTPLGELVKVTFFVATPMFIAGFVAAFTYSRALTKLNQFVTAP